MNVLSLLVFAVLGIILGAVFGSQAELSQAHKKPTWRSKLLDTLLIVTVLGGVIFSVNLFPLGLLGLFAGAILNWMMFDNTVYSG